MSTNTLTSGVVTQAPRVNLLPPEISEAARFRQLQYAMGGAVVAAAVIVGALYMHARSGVTSAQHNLSEAQARNTSLQGTYNGLQHVQATYNQVAAKQALLDQAMSQEIRWSYVLNDLSLRIPSQVWLTQMNATEGGSTSTGTSTGTTTSGPTLGTVTFTGVALRHDDVASWLDALAKEKGFADASFQSSTEGLIGSRKVVNWATSVDLTPKALSNRYTNQAGS